MEKEYGIRFYDGEAVIGPLSREDVVKRMTEDLSVIPVERNVLRMLGRRQTWTAWTDSADFEEAHGE